MYTHAQRFHFAAAHTLRSKALSEEANQRTYGKCANPTGHGHSYTVEVMVSGRLLTDGVLMGHGLLAEIVAHRVIPLLAYQNLNVTFGDDFIPTGENLAGAIWTLLRPHAPADLTLNVRVVETSKNAFVYRQREPWPESAV